VTLPPEGTLSFRLRVPEGFWQAAGEPCRFPPIAGDGLYLEVVITEGRAVEVFVDGPLGRAWSLTTAPVRHEPPTLAISLTWDAEGVVLHLDGERVAEASA
jgi:hypothetical protein